MKTIHLGTEDAVMSRVVNEIDGNFREVQNDMDVIGGELGNLGDSVSSIVVDQTAPANPGITSLSESGYIVDGVLFSEVTTTYTAPSPLGNFKGVYFVVKNYRGSAQLVKESEHNFGGVAGGSATFNVTLQRTGETIKVYLVPKNNFGVSPQDWTTAPSTTVVLDGNASAPNAPTGLAATSTTVGIALSWTQNSELNLDGYKIYRNTTNTFGTATLLNNIGVSRSGAPSYFDSTGSYVTVYYYWVTAVNTAAQESSNSSVASAVSGGNAVTGVIAQGNFGFLNATTSITIYWDGTNASLAFTLRLADGSTVSVPTGSSAVTGLIASNTYKFFPYYDVLTGAVAFVTGTTGSPAVAFPTTAVGGEVAATASQLAAGAAGLNLAGRIGLASGFIVSSTPAAGATGGGDGGGSIDCLAPWMSVMTKQGEVLLEDLEKGDMIESPEGWTEVVGLKYPPQTHLVQLKTANGHILECSPLHPIGMADGSWRYAAEVVQDNYVVTKSGASKVITWSLKQMNYNSVLPSLSPHHSFYANEVLSHNRPMDKY